MRKNSLWLTVIASMISACQYAPQPLVGGNIKPVDQQDANPGTTDANPLLPDAGATPSTDASSTSPDATPAIPDARPIPPDADPCDPRGNYEVVSLWEDSGMCANGFVTSATPDQWWVNDNSVGGYTIHGNRTDRFYSGTFAGCAVTIKDSAPNWLPRASAEVIYSLHLDHALVEGTVSIVVKTKDTLQTLCSAKGTATVTMRR